MKKSFLFSFILSAISISLFAQKSQTIESVSLPAGSGQEQIKLYKLNPVTEEKNDQFEIQSIGGTIFTAANTADGTAASYSHSLQVDVTLVPVSKSSNTGIHVIFYSSTNNLMQAAYYNDGKVTVFYPISFYESIKEKLEQAIAAKKKVIVKVVQKPNGYREGSLIF